MPLTDSQHCGNHATQIAIAPDIVEHLLAQAASVHPLECCGLLLGRAGVIGRIAPARNVAAEPAHHFEIDPQALIDAHRAARGAGDQVIGYYHSHPSGTARPSATDKAQAAGDGKVWAIAVPPAGKHCGDVAFWRDDKQGFIPLSPVITAR